MSLVAINGKAVQKVEVELDHAAVESKLLH